jgi:CDGSH-type Zn-finger protein
MNDPKAPAPAPTVELRPNGPYLVRNLPRLLAADGTSLEAKPALALCRCGQSATKPYCDRTHAKIGFNSARESDPAQDVRKTYIGKDIVVTDNRSICAHAGFCTDELAAVFRSGQTPWIDADGAAAEEVAATVRKCPSGALSYAQRGQDGVQQGYVEPDYVDSGSEPCIRLQKNGPYEVTGGIELQNEPLRQGQSPRRYTLCRCGHSKNKPFCDGSHWDAKFEG